MVTKEDVISEIEKIPDEKMGELYLLVKLIRVMSWSQTETTPA